MKKHSLLLAILLVSAVALIACGDAGSDTISGNKNGTETTNAPTEGQKPTDAGQDVTPTASGKNGNSETSGKTDNKNTPAPTSAPKPQKHEWAGETPSLSDEWTAYYCNFEDPKPGDYLYVLRVKHYFEKPGNIGKFEVIESTYEITEQLNWEYVYFDDIRYALIPDGGGESLMYDYSDVATGVEEFAKVDKIGFLYDGKTLQFGYCDKAQATIIYKTYYLNMLEYKK